MEQTKVGVCEYLDFDIQRIQRDWWLELALEMAKK